MWGIANDYLLDVYVGGFMVPEIVGEKLLALDMKPLDCMRWPKKQLGAEELWYLLSRRSTISYTWIGYCRLLQMVACGAIRKYFVAHRQEPPSA